MRVRVRGRQNKTHRRRGVAGGGPGYTPPGSVRLAVAGRGRLGPGLGLRPGLGPGAVRLRGDAVLDLQLGDDVCDAHLAPAGQRGRSYLTHLPGVCVRAMRDALRGHSMRCVDSLREHSREHSMRCVEEGAGMVRGSQMGALCCAVRSVCVVDSRPGGEGLWRKREGFRV